MIINWEAFTPSLHWQAGHSSVWRRPSLFCSMAESQASAVFWAVCCGSRPTTSLGGWPFFGTDRRTAGLRSVCRSSQPTDRCRMGRVGNSRAVGRRWHALRRRLYKRPRRLWLVATFSSLACGNPDVHGVWLCHGLRAAPPALFLKNTMLIITSLISGLIFGLGLILSGMADPAKVLGFLDLAGPWDPSLALVMAGAIAVGLIGFSFAGRRSHSLLGSKMQLPKHGDIDRRLVGGSLVFGIGWGIAGFCQGRHWLHSAWARRKPLCL